MLNKLVISLLISFFAVLGVFAQTDKTNTHQQSKTPSIQETLVDYLPCAELKAQIYKSDSQTVKEYERAMKNGNKKEADRLLAEIAIGLQVVFNMTYGPDPVLRSGWTQKEFDDEFENLKSKAMSIYYRLGKIQERYKRAAPPRLSLLLYIVV